jgi:ribosomal protein S18 acetylase RimI-like enzyme
MGVDGLMLRSARPDEVADAARPLADSHADDPGMVGFFPDRVRARALGEVFGLTVADALAAGEVHVAVVGGRVVGTAAWLRPGEFPPHGLRRSLLSLPYLFRLLWLAPRSMRRFLAFSMTAARQQRGRRVWFLAGLGVDPAMQHVGIGGRLLRPVLERADASGTTCVLNTQNEANLAYYQRFGFEPAGEAWRAAGGPVSWTMSRRPAGDGSTRRPPGAA